MDDAERAAAYERLKNDPERRKLADKIERNIDEWLRHHWETCDLPPEAECGACCDYATKFLWEGPVCVACATRHAIIGALAVEMLETLGTLIDENHARLDDVAWCRLHNLVNRRLHALRQETRP